MAGDLEQPKSAPTRRGFLCGLSATAALALGAAPATGQAAGLEPLGVGLIGCGRQGRSVAKAMAAVPGVSITTVCDPDAARAEAARVECGAGEAVADFRRLLDRPDLAAVIVATPDHWHAPAALLALAAGKHVYLEKPCSHTFQEADLLRAAARQSGLVVQHGTQSRSNPLIAHAVDLLREGVIGDVLVAKAWNVQRRKSIGHDQPSSPPPGVDYDLWVGPAPMVPFQANRFHANWRWWHAFGCGDIGNDGTHELDYARWGLGVESLPARVGGLGGKYHFDDDQEFPDTASLAFEFPPDRPAGHPRQLLFEMRLWSGNYPHNCDSGVEFHGTNGMLFVSKRGKLELLDGGNKRQEVPAPAAPPLEGSHQADFVAAIRNRSRPRADMDEAFLSVALVHYGNIAVRLGRGLTIEAPTGLVAGDEEAVALLGRTYRPRHWAGPLAEP